jgi:hypothetical protein
VASLSIAVSKQTEAPVAIARVLAGVRAAIASDVPSRGTRILVNTRYLLPGREGYA